MGSMNDKEFIQIYERNKNTVFRIAFSYLRTREDAENVMQDVFFKLFTNPPMDKTNISAWLAMVTRNISLDLIKSKKKELLGFTDFDDTVQYAESNYVDFDIMPYVDRLPENYAAVIRLFYFGELSIKEIAVALNTSESNVKKRLERARNKLRLMIEEEEAYGYLREEIC